MISQEVVFVDTGAWFALADKDDVHHQKASYVYPSLLKNCRHLITSNLIIAESYILILKELGHNAAAAFLEKIKASPRISIVYATEEIEKGAEEILKKFSDQDFSYTDAVSFVIMKRQKIKKAFCFDKHFIAAGFESLP